MSLHKGISFEDGICQHLAEHGWLHAEGDAAKYDRTLIPFLNGIPIATIELKTDFTQSIHETLEHRSVSFARALSVTASVVNQVALRLTTSTGLAKRRS